MRQYQPPRIGPKDLSALEIAPAERYCKWIHHNVHGQEHHSLATLTKSDTPIQIRQPTPSSGMTGRGWRANSALSGLSSSHTLAARSEAGSAETAGMQASCTTASTQDQHQGVRDQSARCTPGGQSFAHALHVCSCQAPSVMDCIKQAHPRRCLPMECSSVVSCTFCLLCFRYCPRKRLVRREATAAAACDCRKLLRRRLVRAMGRHLGSRSFEWRHQNLGGRDTKPEYVFRNPHRQHGRD